MLGKWALNVRKLQHDGSFKFENQETIYASDSMQAVKLLEDRYRDQPGAVYITVAGEIK